MQWFPKSGPWTSRTGITLEIVRNAHLQVQSHQKLANGVETQQAVF